MINKVFAKVFGTSNEREVKRLMPQVEQINALEPAMKQLSDEQLRAKTDEFRLRIKERLDAIEDPEEKDRELKASSTNCCPRPLRSAARPAGACCTCGTSTCS